MSSLLDPLYLIWSVYLFLHKRQNRLVYVWLSCLQLAIANKENEIVHTVRKGTIGHARPAKIQISLRNRAGLSESSLAAVWIAKEANFPNANIKDSDQTAPMRRLI